MFVLDKNFTVSLQYQSKKVHTVHYVQHTKEDGQAEAAAMVFSEKEEIDNLIDRMATVLKKISTPISEKLDQKWATTEDQCL